MKLKALLFVLVVQSLGSVAWATKGLIVTIDQKFVSPKLSLSPGTNKLIETWDNVRRDYVLKRAKAKYDNVYIATGKGTHDDDHMSNLWQQALNENEVVDYMSFVHGG